ncbi:EI24 domain-containing protein [uncultured Amnibacterium sp.]|uniref:EI24 domain-containing protein n=1 Tax=uncultured Amnibacterium sp. TaxID=1631851 RepID=UPI0035CA880F
MRTARGSTHRRSAARRAAAGVGDLLRGFRLWGGSPRLMLLGAVPALLVAALAAGVLIVVVLALPTLGGAVTPFAATWVEPWRGAVRVLASAVILVTTVVLTVLTFTAVTLTVGDPFYERISRRTEERLGDAPPDRHDPALAGLLRAVGDGLRLFVGGLLVAALAVALGLIPVVGTIAGVVVSAVLGGRLLAIELTAHAFDARGLGPRERRRMLATDRARSIGFGAAAYLLFLVPFAAIVAMPAAVAGATMLARAVLADAALLTRSALPTDSAVLTDSVALTDADGLTPAPGTPTPS